MQIGDYKITRTVYTFKSNIGDEFRVCARNKEDGLWLLKLVVGEFFDPEVHHLINERDALASDERNEKDVLSVKYLD